MHAWQSIVAPKRTPAGTVQALDADVNRRLAMPDARKALEGVGAEGNPPSVAERDRPIARDQVKFVELMRSLGLKLG